MFGVVLTAPEALSLFPPPDTLSWTRDVEVPVSFFPFPGLLRRSYVWLRYFAEMSSFSDNSLSIIPITNLSRTKLAGIGKLIEGANIFLHRFAVLLRPEVKTKPFRG